jgi:hypothetical protein
MAATNLETLKSVAELQAFLRNPFGARLCAFRLDAKVTQTLSSQMA